MICSVVVTKEEQWVATDTTTGIASQGKNIDEALANLKKALESFYEDIPEKERVVYPAMLTTLEVCVRCPQSTR